MRYLLTGFTQDIGFRVFAFDGIGDDRVRTPYQVRADTSLMRRYGIRVQELPLLCRAILEQRDEGEAKQSFTYTEADMGHYAADCATKRAASQKRKTPRKPPSENVGAAWRGLQI